MSQRITPFSTPDSPVQLTIPTDVLRPLVESVLETLGCMPRWPAGRLALTEEEAAECIGVKPHVLRDARLRLRLPHARVGRTVTYTAEQLSAALNQMSVSSQDT